MGERRETVRRLPVVGLAFGNSVLLVRVSLGNERGKMRSEAAIDRIYSCLVSCLFSWSFFFSFAFLPFPSITTIISLVLAFS
jgi:hypothetical protein